MKIYKSIKDLPKTNTPMVITIGMFDGIHIGHRSIMKRLLEVQKANNNYQTMVITFSNHPLEILEKNSFIRYISSNNHKINFFAKLNIEHLAIIPFTEKFAKITHIEFLELLIKKYKSLYLIIGNDFKFGNNNIGNVTFLKQKEKEFSNLKIEVLPKIYYKSHSISSSLIRKLITNGNLNIVSKMLERDYFIEGICIYGKNIGNKIGFPTINFINKKMVLVPDGVYKSFLEFKDVKYLSMSCIKKTFIETHVLNFKKLIYNEKVKVTLKNKIRDIFKFNSLQDLKNQLEIDRIKVMSLK